MNCDIVSILLTNCVNQSDTSHKCDLFHVNANVWALLWLSVIGMVTADNRSTMKQKIKIAKTAYVAYLYEDRHAVILHRERHENAGSVEWAEIYERLDCATMFDGRIVFHDVNRDLRFKLACGAYEVCASEPSMENGSDNTKKRNIRVCSFTIRFKDGTELYWTRTPDEISDGLTYQPDCKEAFNPAWGETEFTWGHTHIAKVHRNAPNAVALVAVA